MSEQEQTADARKQQQHINPFGQQDAHFVVSLGKGCPTTAKCKAALAPQGNVTAWCRSWGKLGEGWALLGRLRDTRTFGAANRLSLCP